MRPADFIQSSLLAREHKFSGLIRFPREHYDGVRNEILRWILLREQEMARQLDEAPPENLEISDGRADYVINYETNNRSLVELAGSSNMERIGGALRYFHFYIDRRDRAADRKYVQIDKEGFLTTFVFRLDSTSEEMFLWVTLEYCHSSLCRGRRMARTTPRIFNEIIRNVRDVKLVVHEQTPIDVVKREMGRSLGYEGVVAAVKRERRRAARAGESLLLDPVVTVSAKVGLSNLLDRLRQAVGSLRDTRVRFFDRK